MVGVLRRMNKLRELLNIRHGPGAAILPADVTRIHMEFAMKMNDGHFGPRKFWRDHLTRLKFWNPAVPMIVNRTQEQTGPAVMTLYFRDSAAPTSTIAAAAGSAEAFQANSASDGRSKAPAPREHERVVTIDMKNRHSDVILKEFLEKTGAVPVVPTSQEEAEVREIEERRQRAEIDRVRERKVLEARRREARLLSQARNELAASKAAV